MGTKNDNARVASSTWTFTNGVYNAQQQCGLIMRACFSVKGSRWRRKAQGSDVTGGRSGGAEGGGRKTGVSFGMPSAHHPVQIRKRPCRAGCDHEDSSAVRARQVPGASPAPASRPAMRGGSSAETCVIGRSSRCAPRAGLLPQRVMLAARF